ncbi:DNA replication protein DnaC [Chryseobacterium aquifrigidense]|uniref:DNA replication protein DnaC n=2 Tax=Chryseobacterium aquifrigidense TaxID=558021 RepID=A0A543E9N4_9FLAO|nr:DNA replication protein DnaC [Chryseobacterium aquifrigidense]
MVQGLDSQSQEVETPLLTRAIEYLLINNPDHPVAQKYKELLIRYENDFDKMIDSLPKKQEIVLPELKPMKAESLYNTFKVNFPLVNKKEFDETANNGEAETLVYTLIAYFLKRRSFFNSPLLNKISVPSFDKGIAIIGEPGIGKTAILRTFYEIFKYGSENPLIVKDIEGTGQLLRRYDLRFKYNSVDEVVKHFEAANRHSKDTDRDYHLSLFYKRYELGFNAFDDLLSEDMAKNYGSVDIMKKVLSERYVKSSPTILTLNYYGETIKTTLDEYKARYGDRMYDRFFEMFNVIELQGVTLRR